MSESPNAFPENLPLVDELPPAEEPDQLSAPLLGSQEHSPAEGLPMTPPAEPFPRHHGSPMSSPGPHREPVQEGDECLGHKQGCNLICLDPICAAYRCFMCPECMIEVHADCQQEFTFDLDRFVKALRPDSARLRTPFHKLTELLGTKGLEFTLRGPVDALLAAEEEALANIGWRDFRQPNPHLALELTNGVIHVFSVRLGNLARLFEEVNSKISAETVDELFATTLVAFEKALANELTSDRHSDLHPSLDDNLDMYSSSFSKKNYSDDSQVLEVEMDAGDPNAFFRPHTERGSAVRVFEEGSDIDEPRARHQSEFGNLLVEKDRKKRDGRKAGGTKSVRPKSVAPVLPLKRFSYLEEPFRDSQLVKEEDLEFLETFITKEFETKLIYSSDRDGLSDKAFHRLCDGQGPTLVLVQSDKAVAGGWTNSSWQSPEQPSYCRSSKSTLFSLTKKKLYPIKPDELDRAVYKGKFFGPSFGDDLVVSGLMEAEENHSRLGSVYSDMGVEKPFEELMGASRFAVRRLEVYKCFNASLPSRAQMLESAIVGSTILAKEDCQFLEDSFEEITGARLLYRSKDVPFTAKAFHDACDQHGPTLVVIKSQNHVAGGFTDREWEPKGGYKKSLKSFIISLTKKTLFPIKPASSNQAIFCKESDGPNFGDRDLYAGVGSAEGGIAGESHLGNIYDASRISNPKSFLFGSEKFAIDEFEVYAIEM